MPCIEHDLAMIAHSVWYLISNIEIVLCNFNDLVENCSQGIKFIFIQDNQAIYFQ